MKRVFDFIHKLEDGFLVSALISMLLMAVLQIVLRNFFDAGIFWAESFLRILVLWVAMLGAMVATRESNHISIDAFSRYLKPGAKKVVSFITQVFSGVICGTVAYYSLEFVQYEYQDQTIAFAKVPTWLCQSIIPFGFFVMSIRFMINSVLGIRGDNT
ncbi:MAG: TRAP transporter small permease [Pseudomonadales bacterium]|nr:TRAP transporter small permease [Pseudomonadales bacterium]